MKRIKQLSPRHQIGDFGRGEAKIMEAIGPQRVYSFDHVAIPSTIALVATTVITASPILAKKHRMEPKSHIIKKQYCLSVKNQASGLL